MDLERRQRDAGLPPLGEGRERLASPLMEPKTEAKATGEPDHERAAHSAKRSEARRARARSAGRARALVAIGSVLAAVGLGAGMWFAADSGTSASATEPPPADPGTNVSPRAAQVPAAPDAVPAPADQAPQASSGAS